MCIRDRFYNYGVCCLFFVQCFRHHRTARLLHRNVVEHSPLSLPVSISWFRACGAHPPAILREYERTSELERWTGRDGKPQKKKRLKTTTHLLQRTKNTLTLARIVTVLTASCWLLRVDRSASPQNIPVQSLERIVPRGNYNESLPSTTNRSCCN